MNKIIIGIIMIASLSSCKSVKQIGQINMISNRNVNPQIDYNVISTYSGGSNKELKKSKAKNIESAIDQTVKKIPGGEFLMNAKLYLVKYKYFAAEGDVWGIGTNNAFRGFKVGDKVIFKKNIMGIKEGAIKSLKDDKSCYIEIENGKIIEVKYDQISKAE